MDWQKKLGEEEIRLKALIDQLSTVKGSGLKSLVERQKILQMLDFKIANTRSFKEDCLLGRNAEEKSIMEYRMRMQFPLFSHLDSLLSMQDPVFSDSYCA